MKSFWEHIGTFTQPLITVARITATRGSHMGAKRTGHSALLPILIAFTALSLSAQTAQAAPQTISEHANPQNHWNTCRQAAYALEDIHHTPRGLIAAITLTETGRRGPQGKLEAWPWTINAEGRGYHFTSKREAIRAVRRLMAEGKRSIDIGCMQVNLRFHPRAFTSLEEAFDPEANIAYGISFLKDLHRKSRSWDMAVGNYHSYSPALNQRYFKKVRSLWNKEKRRGPMKIARATRPTLIDATTTASIERSVRPTQNREAQNRPNPLATPTRQKALPTTAPKTQTIAGLRSSYAGQDIAALHIQAGNTPASPMPVLALGPSQHLLSALHQSTNLAALKIDRKN
ncbi:MAG: transglycosylase SLT domain-containing protein [Parvibaculaceae bacterium]|nr:transglycosylase SLT domain-containing protein [Parvibaculaceae bacterium]